MQQTAFDPHIVIVGSGFGGIAAAIELRRHGFRNVTLVERAPQLGGTWFHNSYPGAACDVPSPLYSFSFAQRRDWSRPCSSQGEILEYLRDTARRFGVDRDVVPEADVVSCAWHEATRRWAVTCADGRSWEADAVVLATGQLSRPSYPAIEGREDFGGHSFHSARWDHDYDLRGKRVAVIGTGASAVQFVPEIASRAVELVLFQRTANWFLPRRNRPHSRFARTAVRHLPGLQALRRHLLYRLAELLTLMIRRPRTWGLLGRMISAGFMRRQLTDPRLRRKVWPDYAFGCKRVLFSSRFLRTLQSPNVEVVTDPITALTAGGVVTADGTEREVDCVIYGTGFRTGDFMFPMEVTGAGGRSLRAAWEGGPYAHLGVTVPGFPSMFVMYGPNTNTSGGSIIVYLEAQARYLRQALEQVRDRGAAAIDVRPEVAAASDRGLQARFAGTAWTRCDSWYRDAGGRIVANWPGYMNEYRARTRRLDPAEYEFVPPPEAARGPAARR